MSEDRTEKPEPSQVRQAKGAAREAIGKLIGDDAEIHKGVAEQQAAAPPPVPDPDTADEPRAD